jgi:upstream activation factor subunit UAF30
MTQKAAEAGPASAKKDSAKAGTAKKDGAAKSTAAKKPNALQQKLTPSAELAGVIGDGAVTRGEVVSKVWKYIKAKNLQNAEDKRQIDADDTLKKLFKKDKISMFEMSKILAQNLK